MSLQRFGERLRKSIEQTVTISTTIVIDMRAIAYLEVKCLFLSLRREYLVFANVSRVAQGWL